MTAIGSTNLYSSALGAIKSSNLRLEKSAEKLSSGLRINSAADDASGLAISEKMEAEIVSLNQAEMNAKDAISFLQTGDGALEQSTDILQKMRELVVQAQNTGTMTDNERNAISSELSSLRNELDRVAATTNFNGKNILGGTFAENPAKFHVGSSASSTDSISVTVKDMSSNGLSATEGKRLSVDISDADAMNNTLKDIDAALDKVVEQRAVFGATENRLEYTINNLSTTATNLSAAKSRIADVDYAKEIVNYTKEAMINKVAISMLSQANSQAQNVLGLLQGL